MAVLAFAAYLRRKAHPQLARQTEQIALGFGLFLSLLSLGNSFTAAVNLTLSTVTLVWILTHRRSLPNGLVTLTHAMGLATAASWIFYIAPDTSGLTWGCIALGSAIAEFFYHPYLRSQRLQFNTWGAGLSLVLIGYGLLLESWADSPPWIWLSVPVALTFVANHPRSLPSASSRSNCCPWLFHAGAVVCKLAHGDFESDNRHYLHGHQQPNLAQSMGSSVHNWLCAAADN